MNFIMMVSTFFFSLIAAITVMGDASLAAQTSRSVWDGVYTKEQATRGALTSGLCTQCHGDSFQGDPAPPLTGPDFLAKWDGSSVGDLFELIRQTMPDDDPGALTREQYADLLAYIFSLNKFPAGTIELATNAEPLKQIRFEATKR
jgi:mono/diheme cytochrome c family protein